MQYAQQLDNGDRLTFVPHDTSGLPFQDIAAITGRTGPSARQLAGRAHHPPPRP